MCKGSCRRSRLRDCQTDAGMYDGEFPNSDAVFIIEGKCLDRGAIPPSRLRRDTSLCTREAFRGVGDAAPYDGATFLCTREALEESGCARLFTMVLFFREFYEMTVTSPIPNGVRLYASVQRESVLPSRFSQPGWVVSTLSHAASGFA